MLRIILISLLSLPLLFAKGQMINEMALKDLSVMFNAHYIKSNNIKEIISHTSYKKELRPIVDRNVYNRYIFDKNGRLVQMVEIFKTSPTSIDSLITQFIYQGGKLEEKLVIDGHGQHAYSFAFNDKNDITKMQYHRINEDSVSNKILVMEESYEYEPINDTTYVKWYLNQYGKKYQKEIFTYNIFGYLLSVEKRMVFGGGANWLYYIYDEKGRLVELREEQNGTVSSVKYDYDKAGNVLEKNSYKNTQHKVHDEFLYDSKTSLLKAQLSKDLDTNTIYINKFEVVFW
jgi:YD repeat-containing protein